MLKNMCHFPVGFKGNLSVFSFFQGSQPNGGNCVIGFIVLAKKASTPAGSLAQDPKPNLRACGPRLRRGSVGSPHTAGYGQIDKSIVVSNLTDTGQNRGTSHTENIHLLNNMCLLGFVSVRFKGTLSHYWAYVLICPVGENADGRICMICFGFTAKTRDGQTK